MNTKRTLKTDVNILNWGEEEDEIRAYSKEKESIIEETNPIKQKNREKSEMTRE